MDKTEIYIKMSDHELIQSRWIPEEGDFYVPWGKEYLKGYGPVGVACGIRAVKEEFRIEYLTGKIYKRVIWLPTQNQIQKMFAPGDFIHLNHRFQFFWEREANDAGRMSARILPDCYLWHSGFNSAEQLWLAFYMHEKHEKVWDYEEWGDQK